MEAYWIQGAQSCSNVALDVRARQTCYRGVLGRTPSLWVRQVSPLRLFFVRFSEKCFFF